MFGIKAWASGSKPCLPISADPTRRSVESCSEADGSIIEGCVVKDVSPPVSESPPRKRARFSDVVLVKAEDEDKILAADASKLCVAKRSRLLSPWQPYPTSTSSKPDNLSSAVNFSKYLPFTPDSAEPACHVDLRFASLSPTAARSTGGSATHETDDDVLNSIEEDTGDPEKDKAELLSHSKALRQILKRKVHDTLKQGSHPTSDDELSRRSPDPSREDGDGDLASDDYESFASLNKDIMDQSSLKDRDGVERNNPQERSSLEADQRDNDTECEEYSILQESEVESDVNLISEETNVLEKTNKNWRREQILLNAVLNARDKYTLMPSSWAMHFRGIPLPPNMFYHKVNTFSLRPRIYAHMEKYEYRGAMRLRDIADVQARVRDFRIEQAMISQDDTKTDSEKRDGRLSITRDIVKKLSHVLDDAIYWSRLDGDTAKYGDALPPNIHVIEHLIDESSKESIDGGLFGPMYSLAERWRARMENLKDIMDNEEVPRAPVIYGLVVINHLLYIVSMDASDPQASIHNPIQMNMIVRNQQQWNALAVMVSICWARDKLMVTAQDMRLHELEREDTESDPDA